MLQKNSGSHEARLRYGDGEFTVMKPGDFVRCAVSGVEIPLGELKYWSVDRQEPYADAKISFRRNQDSRAK